MMTCFVPISKEVIRKNLYEPRDNPTLALETDGVHQCKKKRTSFLFGREKDRPNGVGFDRIIRTECVDPSNNGIARGGGRRSSEVECIKWVRETNEAIIVKNPKMEEGPMPYCL
ncbi:hypothetical protein IEQ34_000719 [Dendrobium chrysotoxum]|uniref:Uncharacterized protein n=1 Tax=Dendrobium chrysotoxum TaxID=161865 RepID=A0AAV7HPV5_DENCH|nr:hypothetical protein IEQ34_000719 [Dendrobium chrysotoxum]